VSRLQLQPLLPFALNPLAEFPILSQNACKINWLTGQGEFGILSEIRQGKFIMPKRAERAS
jgi:hypothetical protein